MSRGLGLTLVICGFGALLIYGGFSKYSDQHSGTPGKAKVTSCSRGYNTKYVHKASICVGSWQVPGPAIFGGLGPIDGADSGDVGKTIDVRIHGGDHATVPDIKNAIVLGFGLFTLWKRSSST